MKGGGITLVGRLTGLGMKVRVVFEIYPCGESGVEFFECFKNGKLGFPLEIIFNDFIDGFNLSLTVSLIRLVMKLRCFQFAENPGELFCDIDRPIFQVYF